MFSLNTYAWMPMQCKLFWIHQWLNWYIFASILTKSTKFLQLEACFVRSSIHFYKYSNIYITESPISFTKKKLLHNFFYWTQNSRNFTISPLVVHCFNFFLYCKIHMQVWPNWSNFRMNSRICKVHRGVWTPFIVM